MKKRFQTKKDKILTIANFISISRILLCIPLVYFLEINDNLNSFLIIFLMIMSDLLDGFVARLADEITNFGKLIDPLADKICFMVVCIYLIFNQGIYLLIFFGLIVLRDVIIIIIGSYLMLNQNIYLEANKSGKWFIFIASLMMISVIYSFPLVIISFLYLTSILLMLISTIKYIKKYNKLFINVENQNDVLV
tara:strand:- start:992 stop:1570 length:579 start_codon:yes stop_codon:yes gene_type:complete